MAINLADNTPRIEYTFSNTELVNAIVVPFVFFNGETDLKVYIKSTTSTLFEEIKHRDLETGYNPLVFTVASGGDGATGTILIRRKNTNATYTLNGTLVIQRVMAIQRVTDYQPNGPFEIATLNLQLDQLTAIAGDLRNAADRTLQIGINDFATNVTVPKKADRIGRVLGFHPTTGDLQMYTLEDYILPVVGDNGTYSINSALSQSLTVLGGTGIDVEVDSSNRRLTIDTNSGISDKVRSAGLFEQSSGNTFPSNSLKGIAVFHKEDFDINFSTVCIEPEQTNIKSIYFGSIYTYANGFSEQQNLKLGVNDKHYITFTYTTGGTVPQTFDFYVKDLGAGGTYPNTNNPLVGDTLRFAIDLGHYQHEDAFDEKIKFLNLRSHNGFNGTASITVADQFTERDALVFRPTHNSTNEVDATFSDDLTVGKNLVIGGEIVGNLTASNNVTVNGNFTASNNVTVDGNLTVNGTTTTVNTATLSVEDPLIALANGNNSTDSVDIGFYGLYDTSGSQNLYAGLFRDATDDKFKLFKSLQTEPSSTVNISGTGYTVATLVANIEGTATSLSGVTATATELNYNDITTLGTVQASKTVTADANGNVKFPDLEKLKFGTSDDLEITHDSTNNIIRDNNAKALFIQSDNTTYGVSITKKFGAETMAKFIPDGAVYLYHNSLTKFFTTATGVQVIGSLTGNVTGDLTGNVIGAVTGITSLLNTSLVVGAESNHNLDFSSNNQIKIKTGSNVVATFKPSTLDLASGYNIKFEGATDDGFETTLGVVDPTADRTINLPNASGTLALTTDVASGPTEVIAGTNLNGGGTSGAVTLNLDAAPTGITSIGLSANQKIDFGTTDTIKLKAGSNFELNLTEIIVPPLGFLNAVIYPKQNIPADIGYNQTGFLFRNGYFSGNVKSGTFETSEGIINVKNDGLQSEVRLYCENNNAHYVALQAPAHSSFSGNATVTLPSATGTLLSDNSEIGDLVDVNTNGISDGQVLQYNSSQGRFNPATISSGGGSLTIQDEGSALSTAATTLNFVGADVVASGTGATKTITIGGGSGGGSSGGTTSETYGASLDGKLAMRDGSSNSIYIGSSSSSSLAEPVPNSGSLSSDNIMIGMFTGNANASTTDGNVVMGNYALQQNLNGAYSVALGHQAMQRGYTGNNVAVGRQALRGTGTASSNTGTTNTGVGYSSLYDIQTGDYNVGLGPSISMPRGYYNNSIGIGYLSKINGGDQIMIGRQAGGAVTSSRTYANYNIGIGYQAFWGNGTADYCVGIGGQNYYTSYLAGSRNVALGYGALRRVFSGANNTAIGVDALGELGASGGDGSFNVGLGTYAGRYNKGTNNTFIGYNASNSQTITGNANTVIGASATSSSVNAASEFTLGDSNITSLRCAVTSITSLSDQSDEKAIEDLDLGLDFIKAMKPRKFAWNRRDGKWHGKKEVGFIAQELHEVEMDFNSTTRTRLVSHENPSRLEAQPMNTYPILVKAIQELSAKVDSLQARITELEGD